MVTVRLRSACVLGVIVLAATTIAPSGSSGADVPRAFIIHAYGGTIAKNGGKCLDYAQEVSGAPIVLNICSVSHPILVEELPEHVGSDGLPRRHEVTLRAGTKVIGLRQPEPTALDDAGAPPSAPRGFGLELQDPAGFPAGGATSANSPPRRVSLSTATASCWRRITTSPHRS